MIVVEIPGQTTEDTDGKTQKKKHLKTIEKQDRKKLIQERLNYGLWRDV